jgi:hypothetical protein
MNISYYRKAAGFCGVVLSIVSMIFTIQLLTSFGNNGAERVVYGTFGGAIQFCQSLLAVFIFLCIASGRPGKSLPAFIVWVLLFVLSLGGTIGHFCVSNSTKIQSATAGDANYKLMSDQISQIDKEIESLNAQREDYQRKNWITKGVKPTTEKIDRLMERKAELSKDFMNYESAPPEDSLYHYLAKFFGIADVSQMKLIIFILYSIALDTASVVCLGYSAGFLNFSDNPNGYPPYYTENGGNGGGIGISQGGYAGMNAGLSGVSAQPQHIGMSENTNSPYSTSTVQGYNQTAVHSTVPNTRNTVQHGSTTDSITTDVLLMYISELFPQPERKDGSLKGRRAVADAIGIDQKTADKIHFALKKNGYVRVEGSKTFPNYEQQEMIQAIAGVPENQAVS